MRPRGRARAAEGGSLMFAQEFFRNALLAGTFIALACGLVGYFVVLRAQVFAGDALSHVAFTGALAAAAAGADTRVGLFAATIARGARARRDRRPQRAPTTWRSGSCSRGCSGSGVLFLVLFTGGSGGGNGRARSAGAVRLDLRAERSRRARSPRAVGAAIVASHACARAAAAVRERRPVVAARARRARVRALGARVPGAARRNRRRGHPGGRSAAAARPARGPGGRRAAAHREPLPRRSRSRRRWR